MDDVAVAVAEIAQKNEKIINVYNIGTGIGTSLINIIELISKMLGQEIKCECRESMPSGINSRVLSNEKIRKNIGWQPQITLEEGIRRTVIAKRELL